MRSLTPILLLACACGPQTPDQTDDDTTAPTSGSTTADPPLPTTTAPEDPTTTADPSTTTGDTVGDTTIEPTTDPTEPDPTCPEGQPLTELWALGQAATDTISLAVVDGPIVTRPDGRHAVGVTYDGAADSFGSGYLLLDPVDGAGEFVGANFTSEQGKVLDLAVAPDGGLVLAGTRFTDDANAPYILRFAPDGAMLAEFPLPAVFANRAFIAIVGDTIVIAGDGDAPDLPSIAAFDLDGFLLWASSVVGPDDLLVRDLARGPDDELIVVGDADRNDDGDATTLTLQRFDLDGFNIWSQSLTRPPFASATAAAVTPLHHAVALTSKWGEASAVVAVALDLAGGDLVWDAPVASADPELGDAWARTILVDEAGMTIPVAHHHEFNQQVFADDLRVVVHRLAHDGTLVTADPLPGQLPAAAAATVRATRGACGELVLWIPRETDVWVAAHVRE